MNPKASKNVIQNILASLNFIDRNALQTYIKQQSNILLLQAQNALHEAAEEKEQYLTDLNNKTWNMIETMLQIAIKENHISDQRRDKIYERLLELVKQNNDNPALDIEKINSSLKDNILLSKSDFDNLIELAIETTCENCKKHHKHCKVYKLLNKYNVPRPTGEKTKCKYGYKGGKEE